MHSQLYYAEFWANYYLIVRLQMSSFSFSISIFISRVQHFRFGIEQFKLFKQIITSKQKLTRVPSQKSQNFTEAFQRNDIQAAYLTSTTVLLHNMGPHQHYLIHKFEMMIQHWAASFVLNRP